MANHIVSGYDSDLNELTASLSDLGRVAEEMVSSAITALSQRDSELAQYVIGRDHLANQLQSKVDDDAMRILALRNPMAMDLRRTIGSIRVATDLERIGDLAEGIAKRALNLNDEPPLTLSDEFERMGRQVKTLLTTALDALVREDTQAATQVWMADQDVDESYNLILTDILDNMSDDPSRVTAATALLFAAKNLERVGDHTSNICEVIYFTRNGKQLIEDPAIRSALQDKK
ncbi:MAG: phosphate signaling complex protein PhoU [Pseudomonadota bacterium]